VINVVAALTGSVNPRDYWFKMKICVKSEDGIELSTICLQLKMKAPDWKMRETESVDATGMAENAEAGKKGGKIARRARTELEQKTGKSVVTGENFLPPKARKKKIE